LWWWGLNPHIAWEDMVRVIEETHPQALFVADRAMAVKLSGTEQGVPLPLGEDVPEGQVRGLLSSIKLAVCLERCNDLPNPFMGWATLEREMAGQTNAKTPLPVTADSPASYILTSGTTGDPKGIVYTQGPVVVGGPIHSGGHGALWKERANARVASHGEPVSAEHEPGGAVGGDSTVFPERSQTAPANHQRGPPDPFDRGAEGV
jgi:acyl-coenzyme A synthetase/AMP-(fatty) acid ligase